MVSCEAETIFKRKGRGEVKETQSVVRGKQERGHIRSFKLKEG